MGVVGKRVAIPPITEYHIYCSGYTGRVGEKSGDTPYYLKGREDPQVA